MAHNEYLQIAVEEGVIGLALFLAALLEIARRGLRAHRALPADRRILHAAMGFSALAVALHALVDFPFHIPQLMLPFFFCAVGFGSPRKNEEAAVAAPAAALERSNQFRPAEVARLVSVFFILAFVPLAIVPIARRFYSDSEFVLANSRLELLRQQMSQLPPEASSRVVQQAIANLRRSLNANPNGEQTRHLLAEAYYFQSLVSADIENRSPAGGLTPNVAAIQSVQTAIEIMHESEAYLRYHDTYYMLALFYHHLKRQLPPSERDRYDAEYIDNVKRALYYAPTHVPAMRQYAEWLVAQPNPDLQRVVALRKKIREIDPHYFFTNYTTKIDELIAARDFSVAASTAEAVLQVDPENYHAFKIGIWAHMLAGGPDHRRRVLELTERLRRLEVDPKKMPNHPYWGSYGGLFEAIIRRQWARAEGELDHFGASNPREAAMLFAIEEFARLRQGRRGLPSRYGRPAKMEPDEWRRLILEERAKASFRILDAPERAEAAFAARLGLSGPTPPPEFWVDYAEFSLRRGNHAAARDALAEISRADPHHAMIPRIAGALRGQMPVGQQ